MDQSGHNPVASTALFGVRVIELSRYDAGAACGEILAWLGADVLKVDVCADGGGRYATPEKVGGETYEFLLLNANKRSLMCDLGTDRGKGELRNLIEYADVVLEELEPGAIEKLAFSYDTVRQINPPTAVRP